MDVGVPENMRSVSRANVDVFLICLKNPRRELHWIYSLPVVPDVQFDSDWNTLLAC